MTKGMNSYDSKQRRKIRRRNHVAKDLQTPKYRQRIKESKKPNKAAPTIDEWKEEINNV